MLEYMLTIGSQVTTMFLLMVTGFVVYKGRLIDDEGTRQMSALLLKIVAPASIISAYQREFSVDMARMLLLAFPVAVLCHLVPVLLAQFIFKKGRPHYEDSRLMLVFTNNSFMAIPLLQVLLGSVGVFLGSTQIVVSTILLWTYGCFTLTHNRRSISLKSIFCNPGTIAVLVGLVIFVSPIKLPEVIFSGVKYIAQLNTPLAMLVCGVFIAQADMKPCLKSLSTYGMSLLKLLVVPLLTLAVLWVLPLSFEIRMAMMITSACPCATSAVIMARNCGTDYVYCVRIFAVTTLLSILTMPVVLSLANALF